MVKHEKLKTAFPKGKKNKKRRRREMQDFCAAFGSVVLEKKVDLEELTGKLDKLLNNEAHKNK